MWLVDSAVSGSTSYGTHTVCPHEKHFQKEGPSFLETTTCISKRLEAVHPVGVQALTAVELS